MFGKKLTLDDILKGIDNLPEEDKAKVKAKMEDLYKAEDEREIDKTEEEKSEGEKSDEKREEVADESEEIGKDVDEIETEVGKDEETENADEKDEDEASETEDEETEEQDLEQHEEQDGGKFDEIFDRLEKLEAAIGAMGREPKKADDKTADKLTALERKFS